MATSIDPKTVIKDIVLPIIIAITPFTPNIYEFLTEPEFHFVYESTYQKNPVIEWNRQLDRVIKQIESPDKSVKSKPPAFLLEKIGREIYQTLPAMLAGAGFKPMDKKSVQILNVSKQDLKNIRVYFSGCVGFDSYETWPDTFVSAENKAITQSQPNSMVTIRYDSLPRSPDRGYRQAYVTFYGEDASNCKTTIEAELGKGGNAIGKETNIESYLTDTSWDQHGKENRQDLAFKLFLAGAVLYMYFQIRSIKKRLSNG